MRLLDRDFLHAPRQYVLQCAMAFVVIAGTVAFFNTLVEGVIVAALGSSAFVVFAMPHRTTAMPRRLVGGHVVCVIVGLLCSLPLRLGGFGGGGPAFSLVAGASVSLAILAMVITDTEHPPAAGNALAFAVLDVGAAHVLVTVGAVVLLAIIRWTLRGWLRDLV